MTRYSGAEIGGARAGQSALAIHRLGVDGSPYLAVSTLARSSEVKFGKPGCQYAVGSIAVASKLHNREQLLREQLLYVSASSRVNLAVVTSRLYYPQQTSSRVPVYRAEGPRRSTEPEIDFTDYDYQTSNDALLEAHQGRLLELKISNYVAPTSERLAAFYDKLIELAAGNEAASF